MPTVPVAELDFDLAAYLEPDRWRSPNTLANTSHKLRQWQGWLGDTAPADATNRHVRQYLDERRKAGIASSTRLKDWQALTGFYRFALASKIVAKDPTAGVPAPAVTNTRPKTRAAKRAEVDALEAYFVTVARRHPDDGDGQRERAWRNAAMLSVMYRCGLRVGELPWIDLADLFETDSGLRVIRLHDDHVKGGRGRDVLVLDDTWRLIRRYLRDRGMAPGPLFRGRAAHTRDATRRLSTQAIKSVVRRASIATGVAVSPHQFRRGWTAAAIRAGVDGAALQVQGGWGDDRMPRRYLADEERAASLDRYAAAMGATKRGARADELAARRGRTAG